MQQFIQDRNNIKLAPVIYKKYEEYFVDLYYSLELYVTPDRLPVFLHDKDLQIHKSNTFRGCVHILIDSTGFEVHPDDFVSDYGVDAPKTLLTKNNHCTYFDGTIIRELLRTYGKPLHTYSYDLIRKSLYSQQIIRTFYQDGSYAFSYANKNRLKRWFKQNQNKFLIKSKKVKQLVENEMI